MRASHGCLVLTKVMASSHNGWLLGVWHTAVAANAAVQPEELP